MGALNYLESYTQYGGVITFGSPTITDLTIYTVVLQDRNPFEGVYRNSLFKIMTISRLYASSDGHGESRMCTDGLKRWKVMIIRI